MTRGKRSAGTIPPTPTFGAPPAGPWQELIWAVCPPAAGVINYHTWLTTTFAVISDNSKLFHQIICSPKTAMVPRQGPVGAADPRQAVNNILGIPHTFVESGQSAGNEPRHEHQAPNC